MKKHLALMTAGATLALVTATAASHAEDATTPRRPATTQTFTSRVMSSVAVSRTSSIEVAKDVAKGKAIGVDTTVAHFDVSTGIVTGEFSFTRKDGVLTGTFTIDTKTLDLSGTIDAGEGAYRGVTGTVTGHAVNRKVTVVTVSYRR